MIAWRFWESRATRADREAAVWRAAMEEPASQAEVNRFEAWLRADPANTRAYQQSDRLAATGQKLARERAAAGRPAARWLAPAALIAVAAVALGAWVVVRPPTATVEAVANRGDVVRTTTPKPGLTLTLDSGARVEIASGGARPDIRLIAGRVRLVVRRPGGEAVTMAATGVTLVSRDCELDLSSVEGGVRVQLLSGQAAVAPRVAGGSAIGLPRGRPLIVRNGALAAAPSGGADTSWTLARVGFDDEPLARVVAAANAAGDPKIVVADPRLAGLRVTASLDLRDKRKLARKLAAALDLRVIDRGDALILSR